MCALHQAYNICAYCIAVFYVSVVLTIRKSSVLILGLIQTEIFRNVTVFCLLFDGYQENVPKRPLKEELKLNGKLKRISVTKETSPPQVNEKICSAYKIKDYTFLECIGGCNELQPADEWQRSNCPAWLPVFYARRLACCIYTPSGLSQICTYKCFQRSTFPRPPPIMVAV